MIFKTRKKLIYKTSLHANEQTIEQVNSTILRSNHIDEQLSWKNHVNHVAMKMSKMTGAMAKAGITYPAKHYLFYTTP